MRTPLLVLGACLAAIVALVLVAVPFPVAPGLGLQVDVLRDFTPEQLAREEAFHRALRPWGLGSLAWGVIVAGILAFTGWGSRIVDAMPGAWPVRTALGSGVLLLVGSLATVPLDVRVEQALRRYGLSTQSWPDWLDQRLRGLVVVVVTALLVILPLMALARRWPQSWWLPGSALAGLLVVGGSFAYPVVVEPVFQNFVSLTDGPVRSALLELADRDGVAVDDVLVVDASRRTTALNAYVSGLGSTRRIVLYDTLLETASQREIELVVAHELGHVKTQDVAFGTALGALGAAAAVCALFLLLRTPVLRPVGASGPGDPKVVPLLLFLAASVPLFVAPLTNLVSRHLEARADLHSLELTGDVETFIASEKRLTVTNLSDLSPHPVLYAWFFSHPSGPERIAFARAWQQGR